MLLMPASPRRRILSRPANRHLRLAAYNLAFSSLPGIYRQTRPPQRIEFTAKPCPSYQATLSKNGIRGDKKVDRTTRTIPCGAFPGKVAINWRVSHVPGTSPRRGEVSGFAKFVNHFRHIFLHFSSIHPETLLHQGRALHLPPQKNGMIPMQTPAQDSRMTLLISSGAEGNVHFNAPTD